MHVHISEGEAAVNLISNRKAVLSRNEIVFQITDFTIQIVLNFQSHIRRVVPG